MIVCNYFFKSSLIFNPYLSANFLAPDEYTYDYFSHIYKFSFENYFHTPDDTEYRKEKEPEWYMNFGNSMLLPCVSIAF